VPAPRRSSTLSGVLLLAAIVAATATTPNAQVSGPTGLVATRSVNMVSGNSWPNGDPYLQRQNEPSVAVSTRNTQHLLAGANDYRTVDLPGLSTGPETGDAWLGLFKSFDGGERWQSTLLPGYPQDTSAEGMASPLKAYQAGADAVVRPGTNGLLYFSGLAFNRGTNGQSGVFMSRFIDNNNKENGDPIKYLGTTMIDRSNGADFIDKPWMAVDVPRQGAKSCKITQTDLPPAVKPLPNPGKFHKPKKDKKDKPKPKDPKPYTQTIPAGTIYVAYSRITTVGTDVTSRIMLSASDDCGASWSRPVQISNPADKVNQGATIAIDPRTGVVYVAWRQFGMTVNDTDSIVVARTANQGKSFEATTKVHKFNAHRAADRLRKMIAEHRMGDADEVAEIQPFDQGTAEDRFRTNAYPTIAVDDEGRAYLAWTERGYGQARSSATDGDARVVVATSKTGAAWTTPRAVDVGGAGQDLPGHQLMPSIAFAAGKLVVVYYDLREDVSQVFNAFISEQGLATSVHKRHTIDIRAAYATKGDVPVFGPSTRVSQYLMGSRPGSNALEQMQYNAPNLPLFKLGTVPFMGDYIDLAPSPMFVQEKGAWKYNSAAQAAPVFHVVWTDNRDVRPPRDGNWQNYTPVKMPGAPGTFDVNQPAPACVPGQTGMRNQNIYSARLTFGLVTGSPGNAKPLDPSLPRGFVVFAQNTTTAVKTYRMTIASQPAGGKASFTQTSVAGQPDPLLSVDVSVPAKSMVTRTVFITSTDPHAQVPVDVNEISAPAMPIISGGLSSRVVLNPDISNPDISNPDISNPDISNPDISNAEVYNPDISNPDISNPDISNPDISNPDISNPDISNVVVANPDISNPDISNPDISNPDISNPDISNPDISNPDISNGALTDVTWTIVNTGNTTASFNVNLFLANAAAKLGGVKTQLIVHKTYTTPVADECTLKNQVQTVLVANVPNPTFQAPGTATPFDPSNPAVTNTTVWLEPGGTSKITLRIVDPNPSDNITIDPVRDVTPVVTAEPKNTEDIGTVTPPPATVPPTPDDVLLNFNIAGQPTNTILTRAMSPVVARAMLNGAPAPGVQVTVAIANNPAGGHLSGTTTVLTDANGNAIFPDLSIEKAGIGYRLSASASAFGALPDLSAPFDITLAPVTAAAVGGTFTFDGQPHGASCSVVAFDSVVLPGALSYSSGGAPIDAGEYTATCSYAGNGYYGPASNSAAITIAPAASSTAVTCSDTTYTGTAQQPCTSAVTGAGGLNTAAPVIYSNNVSAGTASASSTYAGDANHYGSSGSANFTIAPATPTAEAVGGSFVYDGAPHPGSCSVTGVAGQVLAGAISWSSGTPPVNPGLYTVTCSFPAGGNYTAANDTDTIGITNPYIVTKTVDDGSIGTLRFAINAANANPDLNTISFALAGAAPFTITPATPLPPVTQPVIIDGLTQPGAATFAPVVKISGALTGPGARGLDIQASGVTVRGLGIGGFSASGIAVPSGGHNGNTIEDNVLTGNAFGVALVYSNSDFVRRNVLSGNNSSGLLMIGGVGNTVSGNRIGTTPDGMSKLANGDNGITMYDGTTNALIDSNVISGNNSDGIDAQFSGAKVDGLRIVKNIIGLAVDGDTVLSNRTGGVSLVQTEGAVVGEPGGRNVISGNGLFDTGTPAPCDIISAGPGVRVTGLSTVMPAIKSNYIGLNQAGTDARPNVFEGVALLSKARVGGPGANEGNLIAGNGCAPTLSGAGIIITSTGAGAIVQGNTIGLSATGVALGNGYSAISGFSTGGGTEIGGFNAGEGNVLTGNNRGIAIYQNPGQPVPSGFVIQGNQIGTNAAGTMPGNSASGIDILNATNVIVGGGAPGSGNLIKGNGGAGIQVAGPSTSGVTMLANSIDANGGLGIDLVNGPQGPTANDPGDGDTGPNGFQNFPVLSNPSNAGPTTSVDFTLDSDDANAQHTVQVFVSPNCDASGHGEGAKLVGSFMRTTAGGSVSGTLVLNEPVAPGNFLTATSTDDTGNTSEFSACLFVPATVTITSATPGNAKGGPGSGFVVLRGNNLPTDVAVVQSGATTDNGFVFLAPSGPNAVWVRLPGGLPLGPATIQLKNNIGTIVSNAIPVTITADPGTPVITGIFDDTWQPITIAPVAAGSAIRVSADGIDTSNAVVRFTQGANTWDLGEDTSVAALGFGVASQVIVPANGATGTISVSVRQGTSPFSAPVNINVTGAAPTFVGPVGGGGGSPYTIMCPSGTVATALRGRAGDDIDRTELMCSPVLPGPALGAESSAGAVGGFGGNDYGAALTCPAGYAMTGIHGLAGTVVWGGNVVDTIGVTCTSVTTGAVYQSGTVGNQTPANPFSLNCAAGKEVVGIAGGQGGLLDRIGIYCSDAAAPLPAPAAAEPDLLSGETGLRPIDERSEFVEHVVGRAIVEENRRRFTAPR
jgi:hypothetical protein